MKDVGGVAETRSLGPTEGRTDGITHTRMEEGHFYSPPPPTSGDNKKAIYKISNQSDKRHKRSCGDKIRPMEEWTDGCTHRLMRSFL